MFSKKLLPLFFLVFISIFYSFNFANLNNLAIKSEWTGNKKDTSLSIILKTPLKLGKVYLYSSKSDGDFELETISESGIKFKLPINNTSSKDKKMFRWLSISTSSNLKLKQLNLITINPTVQITQIALYDVDGKYLTNYQILDKSGTDLYKKLVESNSSINKASIWLSSEIFDESFYATSAYQYINNIPPLVDVHPQLGILLISKGITAFGMNSFGWRIIPLFAGILIIYLVYVFSIIVFNNKKIAIFATLIISFDFMQFVVSRLALLEVFVTLFLIMQYIFMYLYLCKVKLTNSLTKGWLYFILTAICLGLATSCKWSALFSLPLMLICIIYSVVIVRFKPLWSFIALLTIAIITSLLIYCGSFIPVYKMLGEKNFIHFIWSTHKYIYYFQSIKAAQLTDNYISPWWSWPLDMHPFLIFKENTPDGLYSAIALIGNPLFWWGALIAIVGMIIYAIRKKDLRITYILLIIFAQFIPYAFIKRPGYIYYMYTIAPFIAILLAKSLNTILTTTDSQFIKFSVYLYLVTLILLFIVFYPILSGTPIKYDYITNFLEWYPTWKF